MYKVVKQFKDLQDNNHQYLVGDTYPRQGIIVTEKRINELKSSANKQKQPLIEKIIINDEIKEVEEAEMPKKKTRKSKGK